MNEYLIQETTLSSLADEIRVLSGTEDTLTPSQMTSNVQSANDEVDAQSALIDQLSAALEGKAGGSGSGNSVQYEIITIPAGATSATYTLPRVTAAYGSITQSFDLYVDDDNIYNDNAILSIRDTIFRYISTFEATYIAKSARADFEIGSGLISYTNGVITWDAGAIIYPISLVLINDPNADAISK